MQGRHGIKYVKATFTVVVVVLLVKTFLLTSCFIPFSGMENSLYKGEGVLVSKVSYGVRMPFVSLLGYHRWGNCDVKKGDIVLFNNPQPADNSRSIDLRDIYISRCVALPGETIELNEELVPVGNRVFSPNTKDLYVYAARHDDLLLKTLADLDIRDNILSGFTEEGNYIRSFSNYEYYLVTQRVGDSIRFTPLNKRYSHTIYPLVVPSRNKAVKVYTWNARLLCNTIVYHEHRKAHVVDGHLYVDGQLCHTYTFSKNYYWMSSNEPENLNDSRLFGFVPEDHIIGRANRIWYPSTRSRFMRKVE